MKSDLTGLTDPTLAATAPLPDASDGRIPWGELLLGAASPMLAMGTILNFAPLLPLVQEEFGLTNTWSGLLMSSSILTHTLLMMPAGQIVDTVGAKRSVVLAQLLIGLSLIASGLSTGLEGLMLCRLALGVGTATAFVSGLTFVNTVVPVGGRTMAQGIYGAGANSGVLLVLVFSERLTGFGGWRGAFAVEGLLALGIAALSMACLRATPPGPRGHSGGWPDILRRRPLYLLGLANALTYGGYMAIAAWVATFLWRADGVSLAAAGPIAGVMAVAAAVARGAGGVLSAGREKAMLVACCLVTAVSIGLVPLLPGVVPQVVALLVFGWFSSAPFGAIFSSTARLSGANSGGRSFSLVTFVSNIGALSFPPVIGCVLDATSSFVLGFGVVAAACLAGAAVLALWLPESRSP